MGASKTKKSTKILVLENFRLYGISTKSIIRYSSNVMLRLLEIFVEWRARVEQTYFSALMAYRSRDISRNKVVPKYTIVHTNLILLGDFFTSKFHFLSLLDTRCNNEMKPMSIILEGKAISSI